MSLENGANLLRGNSCCTFARDTLKFDRGVLKLKPIFQSKLRLNVSALFRLHDTHGFYKEGDSANAVPTNRNCTTVLPAFGVIARVSLVEVQ